MGKLVVAVAVVLLVVPCSGKTLTVDDNGPADYRTIQEAVNKSWHGDTVVVKPGTYRERVTFGGRRITLRSEDPDNLAIVQATIIAGQAGSGVVFDFGERKESVLTGFTIVDGGIVCSAASPTIAKNVIRNCLGSGIRGQKSAAPIISGNQILANTMEGVYSCAGPIQGNTIADNNAGIAFCNGPIVDNLISDNGPAGGVYSCGGEMARNTVAGNHAAISGGGFFSCSGSIHHNVIAGNRAGVAGGGLHQCTQAIYNNTIVGNRAGDTGGGVSQCTGAIYNNIIAFNQARVGGGIHGLSNNTYNSLWANGGENFGGGALFGIGEVLADPVFVAKGYWSSNNTVDPGDDFWVDGDFHLQSQAGHWDRQRQRWTVDSETSLCIDAGKPSSDWTAELWPHGKRINLGAFGGTAEASLSTADLGLRADLDNNEQVGPTDLKRVCRSWLSRQHLLAEDLDRDGLVDLNDFALLASSWRMGPPLPAAPIPDPMTWAVRPYGAGPYSIAMVATMATSTDGTGVEYYFEDYFSPQYNSGWLFFGPNEPRYEQKNLRSGAIYWYRVKARNRGNRLETGWSAHENATTLQEDFMAPLPNPMTWQTAPTGVSGASIRMVATTATDESGVEYQFECTSHPAYSSAWQDSPTYELTAVPPGSYTFRVRARDKSPNHNTTLWSVEASVDFKPPSPNPMKWEVEPKEINIGGHWNSYYATMTAVEATDEAGVVEYLFECTSDSRYSSGWRQSREYTVQTGPKGRAFRFRVKARDTSPSHNQTGWSPELPAL